MAENRDFRTTVLSSQTLSDLKRFVWGPALREDVFQRWSQGFVFSEHEPTALLQHKGGPCAVLAPLQAFVLRQAVFGSDAEWRQVTGEQSVAFLIAALRDILVQCCSHGRFVLVYSHPVGLNELQGGDNRSNQLPLNPGSPHPAINSNPPSPRPALNPPASPQQSNNPLSPQPLVSEDNENEKLSDEYFHSRLRILETDSVDQLELALKSKIDGLRDTFGVIMFLYSVLLTKGIDQIKNEMEDPNEPLIDEIHGHGSQSLINLLIGGRAVSNVWDNDKDVSGLKLQGISNQPVVGFLTLLEHLRYCEVGWFLKCPQFPIWVLGSETHLTVLFSREKSLCTPETPEAAAKRIFKSYDPDGNNFISAILLGDVLRSLELYAESEYVDMMVKKLDSDETGIILLNDFMDEYFPDEKSTQPGTFVLYHYNGLKNSSPDSKVTYQEGQAVLLDFGIKMYTDNSPVLTCLQTKWPGLEVEWTGGCSPSLN